MIRPEAVLHALAIWLAIHVPYIFFQHICARQLRGITRVASFLPLPVVLISLFGAFQVTQLRDGANVGFSDLMMMGALTLVVAFVAAGYCVVFLLMAEVIRHLKARRRLRARRVAVND